MDITGFEAGVDANRGSVAAAAPALRLAGGSISGRRLRWGLTGLATVFLIVMAAAAGRSPGGTAAQPSGAGEPLAVLGVAPGPATRPPQP